MLSYIGSGPYCFSNSLAMSLASALPDGGSPAPSVIEVLTGSPFGFQLMAGELPFFDPYGWDPEVGLDAALELLGVSCVRTQGGEPEQALARLRAASAEGPALAGPMDMGLLLQQPGSGSANGADHYVLVLEVTDDAVVFHDPHGHPYATLPVAAFLESWRAEEVSYLDEPYNLRTEFVRQREVSPEDALRASLPRAVEWLDGITTDELPPGTLGGAAGLEELADQVLSGLNPDIRTMLEVFSVRTGTRRLADAAAALARIGHQDAAEVLTRQARLLGALQYPVVAGDDKAVAAGLRALAPTYAQLRTALAAAVERDRERAQG